MAAPVNPRQLSPQRDQDATPFSTILTELCRATGARCAALVDREGETVDYAGRGDPFDIRILAAEGRLLLQHVETSCLHSDRVAIMIRAEKKSFWVESLPEGYALVLQLPRRAVDLSSRALSWARWGLCQEAGCGNVSERPMWCRVEVEETKGKARRPLRVTFDRESQQVTVLGVILQTCGHSDRSFRIRLESGEERNLIREPFGHWYLEAEL